MTRKAVRHLGSGWTLMDRSKWYLHRSWQVVPEPPRPSWRWALSLGRFAYIGKTEHVR